VETAKGKSREEIINRLSDRIDSFENYTRPHAHLMADLAAHLGRRLGLTPPDITAITEAALLHDLGLYTMMPAYHSTPGPLTFDERMDLWRHPIIGEQQMAKRDSMRHAQLLVRWHHEWWNGSGYPDMLAFEDIPIGARILRAVELYSALVSDRPYRAALNRDQAIETLKASAGIECDPYIVKALVALLEDIHAQTEATAEPALAAETQANASEKNGAPDTDTSAAWSPAVEPRSQSSEAAQAAVDQNRPGETLQSTTEAGASAARPYAGEFSNLSSRVTEISQVAPATEAAPTEPIEETVKSHATSEPETRELESHKLESREVRTHTSETHELETHESETRKAETHEADSRESEIRKSETPVPETHPPDASNSPRIESHVREPESRRIATESRTAAMESGARPASILGAQKARARVKDFAESQPPPWYQWTSSRYNKKSLLGYEASVLRQVEFRSIAIPFTNLSRLDWYLKAWGKLIFANDPRAWAGTAARAMVEAKEPLSEDQIMRVLEDVYVPGTRLMNPELRRWFGETDAWWMDNLRRNIDALEDETLRAQAMVLGMKTGDYALSFQEETRDLRRPLTTIFWRLAGRAFIGPAGHPNNRGNNMPAEEFLKRVRADLLYLSLPTAHTEQAGAEARSEWRESWVRASTGGGAEDMRRLMTAPQSKQSYLALIDKLLRSASHMKTWAIGYQEIGLASASDIAELVKEYRPVRATYSKDLTEVAGGLRSFILIAEKMTA
jgi:hypothetical protein